MKLSESSAMVVERIQVANLTDGELVIEAERQLSWSNRPSPGNPRAPLGEVLFCNAVVPVMAARLAGRPNRQLPGMPGDDRQIEAARLNLVDDEGELQLTVEERRRAVAALRSQLVDLPDKDFAATARFHFATCRGALSGRGYDPRLAEVVLPEMLRRLGESRSAG